MFVSMKSLISILLLVGIEKLAPTQAMSLERNHHNLVRLTRRRMGQESNLKMTVTQPCDGRICATVAGKVIGARLAAAPPCARQDIADQLITDAKTNPLVKDDKLRAELIAWAILICESEQNTHPDYQKNPQTQRNSMYCLKAPINHELDNCIPKQFEGNDPEVFFDPKVGSVARGSRPETFPRQKQPGASPTQTQNTTTTATAPGNTTASTTVTTPGNTTTSTTVTSSGNTTESPTVTAPGDATESNTLTAPGDTTRSSLQLLADSTPPPTNAETKAPTSTDDANTVSASANTTATPQTTGSDSTQSLNTAETKKEETKKADAKVEEPKKEDAKVEEPKKEDTKVEEPKKEDAKVEDPNKDNNGIKKENPDQGGKKGAVDASKGKVVDASTLPEKCNKPEVRYDGGLGGRKATEMSYEPVDTIFYAHGTALNFQIITDAICDKILACLKEAKKQEDEVQKIFKSCKDVSKAIGPVKKDGKAADAWNAAFGISTNLKSKDSQ